MATFRQYNELEAEYFRHSLLKTARKYMTNKAPKKKQKEAVKCCSNKSIQRKSKEKKII